MLNSRRKTNEWVEFVAIYVKQQEYLKYYTTQYAQINIYVENLL